jgi:hypothetical protein
MSAAVRDFIGVPFRVTAWWMTGVLTDVDHATGEGVVESSRKRRSSIDYSLFGVYSV